MPAILIALSTLAHGHPDTPPQVELTPLTPAPADAVPANPADGDRLTLRYGDAAPVEVPECRACSRYPGASVNTEARTSVPDNRLVVIQREQVLNAPAVLDALGDRDGATRLRKRVLAHDNVSGLFRSVAAVGIAGLGAGVFGMVTTDRPEVRRDWSRLLGASAGVAFGGIVLSAAPAARADRLYDDITTTVPADELAHRVARHNEEID